MASDNASYFSNAVPNDNATFDGNIFRVDATGAPKYAIGFRVSRGDGNVYRYGQFGTLTSAARLAATVNADFLAESDNCLTCGTAATAVVGEVVAPGVVGAKYVQVIQTGTVANQYAGGYLIIESGTGSSAASTYRIKRNTAAGTPVAGSFYIELYDRLQVTLDATTDIAIITNIYSDLIGFTEVTATAVAGVTVANQTANSFGFVQTWGVGSCLADAHTPAIGQMMVPSKLTVGAIGPFGGGSVASYAGTELNMGPIVGYTFQAATASRQTPLYITIGR